MKTVTILIAGLASIGAVPVHPHQVDEAFRRSEHAHAIAAELMAMTQPHAHCSPAWNHVARMVVDADNAAAAVSAALAAGDFCAARDASERLSEIADHLKDDVEDLDRIILPFDRRTARREMRRLERLADDLDDVARDLRRDARRLDESQDVGLRTVPQSVYIAPTPVVPPVSGYRVLPDRSLRSYETTPYVPPTRGYDHGIYGREYRGTAVPGYESSLGPGLTVPPSDAFGPVPRGMQRRDVPATSGEAYYGVSPSGGVDTDLLPPGLSKKSKVPPGHLKKIEQHDAGPALLPPSAMHDSDYRRR